jgi:hypothetical protein
MGGPVLAALGASAAVTWTGWDILRGRRPDWRALAGDAGLAVYVKGVRPWLSRWGATDEEVVKELPGDETVSNPRSQQTRAVTVHAPVEQVWPWLAQIGQDRAGFYSYDWLGNLAGCRVHNADRIHPEWQERGVGEVVRLWPSAGLTLVRLDPGRALAMSGGWYFALEPTEGLGSRLIARWRHDPDRYRTAFALLIEFPHFLMERRMLLGIKERAERAAGQASATAAPAPPR